MIAKVVHKLRREEDTPQRDLEFWLGKTPEERLEAVEIMRKLTYGKMGRMRLVAKVINRETGEVIKTYRNPTRKYRKKMTQTKRLKDHS